MKSVFYIANIRLPTEKAHGIQIMEMCSALSQNGAEVELVVPRRINPILEDPFVYYDIPPTFTITRVSCLDLVRFGKWGFWVQSLTFALSARLAILFRPGVVFSRDALPLFFCSGSGRVRYFEVHRPLSDVISWFVLARVDHIFPISRGLRKYFLDAGVTRERMTVLPDGVDLAQFDVSASREDCRTRVGLPRSSKLVLYTGHLYARKGADVFAESARNFPPGVTAVIVGGTVVDLERFRQTHGDIPALQLLGHRLHSEMPYFLKSADVLVLPNSGASGDSSLYTSPMKLFEYMASETPIVASDVPSLREVLTDETATFVPPDNPRALAQAILTVIESGNISAQRARLAKNVVFAYTWEERARTVISKLTVAS